MELITNNHRYSLRLFLSAILAGILLWLYSFWVPFSDGFYYEWIQADNKWIKLILTDPDPVDIPPGKYDGQIIAIKR